MSTEHHVNTRYFSKYVGVVEAVSIPDEDFSLSAVEGVPCAAGIGFGVSRRQVLQESVTVAAEWSPDPHHDRGPPFIP